MSELNVIARGPIAPTSAKVDADSGWEVSARSSRAELTLTDCTPLAKVLVRGPDSCPFLAVGNGRAARDADGALVIGSAPGEWLVVAPAGTAPSIVHRVEFLAAEQLPTELVSVIDLTHGRAMIRLTGARSADVLAKVCGIDLSEDVTPNGAAFRSSVAKLATDVVRDDWQGARSYLLHCERSSGQYLFDALIDAGNEFGIDIDGWRAPGI